MRLRSAISRAANYRFTPLPLISMPAMNVSAMGQKDTSDTPADATSQAHPRNIVRAIQLDAAGLRRLLGPLEAELMEAVWFLTAPAAGASAPDAPAAPEWVTVGDVCRYLGPSQNYKTTQTVMNRLMEKGALQRRRGAHLYAYRARMTRDELIRSATREALDGLLADFGDVALAQLITTVREVSPERLALLERLMREDNTATTDTSPTPSTEAYPTSESGSSQAGDLDTRGGRT